MVDLPVCHGPTWFQQQIKGNSGSCSQSMPFTLSEVVHELGSLDDWTRKIDIQFHWLNCQKISKLLFICMMVNVVKNHLKIVSEIYHEHRNKSTSRTTKNSKLKLFLNLRSLSLFNHSFVDILYKFDEKRFMKNY